MQNLAAELEQEQAYVSMLYRRLDTLRERAQSKLERTLRSDGGGNVQARVDRDALVARHSGRLAQLAAAEHGLCFGRLDRTDGSHLYIGRLGLLDDDREPLLVDWRAPAAQPFYRATWANRDGVVRRRHLRTRGREVLGIEDDVLDLESLSDTEREGLSGEAALLAALTASRTGRMTDIVATIQGEQDRIIRSGLPGVLVVQGGPGTGKTAVALHRAAYLLYTHRQRLSRRGVLVVGPNPTFLRYIEQVLPSLGETDVLLSTVGGLFPGVDAIAEEPLEVAAVKGDPRMVEVLAAAITDRQRVPDDDIVVEVGGQRLVLDPATAERARKRARATGQPHNQARTTFRGEVVETLTDQLVAALTRDLPEVDFDEEGDELLADLFPDERLLDPDRDEIRAELAGHPAVRSALDRFWPKLTAQRLVADLLTSAERLAAAGAALAPAERDLLLRPAPAPAGGDDPAAWDLAGLTAEVTPNRLHYTVDESIIDPNIDHASWRLRVDGLVGRPVSLGYDDLLAMPAIEQYVTLQCISNLIGGDLVGTAKWIGVPLAEVLRRAGGAGRGAVRVVFHAVGGYSDSLPLAKALEPTTVVAYGMNGRSLPRAHGFPARIIAPGIYGMKNVKWLERIEVVDYDYQGYWQRSDGWDNLAEIKTASRIDVPAELTALGPGGVVAGLAWAGDRGIRRVEVSFDGGTSWVPATLRRQLAKAAWRQWRLPAPADQRARTTLRVRAVDGRGELQTPAEAPPHPSGASGYHRIDVVSE